MANQIALNAPCQRQVVQAPKENSNDSRSQPFAVSIFCAPALDTFDSCTGSFPVPGVSIWNESRHGTKQADVKPSEAKAVHQRPAVIQELQWRPQHYVSASSQSDPVKDVLFSFYNDELFRMVVNYDPGKTLGLTNDDMVSTMSAAYGTPTRPIARTITFSSAQGYSGSGKILARWEDAQYSFNLFRSSYQPNFGMVVFSKRLDALARLAIVNSIRAQPARRGSATRS